MSNRDVLLYKADLLAALHDEGKPVELAHAVKLVRNLRDELAAEQQRRYEGNEASASEYAEQGRQLREAQAELAAALAQEPVGIKSAILDNAPSRTTHIRKSGRRSFSGGEFAVYFECFKFEAGEWSYYYTDNDNEYPHWRSLNGGHYRNPDEIIKTLIPLTATAPAAVPDDVDLWSFLRDVLKRGAAVESQFSQQGYETFISEIEAAARKEDSRLRAMLASTVPPAVKESLTTAAPAPAAVPEGYVLVPVCAPVSVLMQMHEAYWGSPTSNHWHENSEPLWRKTYATMLSAATSATQEGK